MTTTRLLGRVERFLKRMLGTRHAPSPDFRSRCRIVWRSTTTHPHCISYRVLDEMISQDVRPPKGE